MFVYMQSFFLIMLEVLCCKIFFETFGKKRKEDRRLWNFAILTGWMVSVYFAAMVAEQLFFVFKQGMIVILTALFMMLYLQMGFLKSFILAALFQGLLIAIDYCVLLLNISVFQNMPQMGEDHYIESLLLVIMGKILLFIAVLVIQRYMGKDCYADLTDAEWLRFLIFPIFTIYIIATMITTSGAAADQKKEDLLSLIAFCLAGMNMVVFSLIQDILKREEELRKNKVFQLQAVNQTKMYRSISEDFEKQRKKTHEYKNQIMCMEALATQKKYDELKEYIRNINGSLSKELYTIRTNHVIVDAILNSKYQEMSEKKIVFVFKMNDLSKINMDDEDIVVILSNLLNNAIEACEQCMGKRMIKVKFVQEEHEVILSVKNTYAHKVIYQGEEIQTTKKQEKGEHGIGIKNIADTITKYGGYYVIQNDGKEFYFSSVIPQ